MSEDDLDAIEERMEKALAEVSALCNGPRRWTMSIPAKPHDSDIVVSDALRDIRQLVAEVRKARPLEGYTRAYVGPAVRRTEFYVDYNE